MLHVDTIAKSKYLKLLDVLMQIALIVLGGYAIYAAELAAGLVFMFLTLGIWQMLSCLVIYIANRKNTRLPLRRFYEKSVLISTAAVIVSIVIDKEDILMTAICVYLLLAAVYLFISTRELRRYYSRT